MMLVIYDDYGGDVAIVVMMVVVLAVVLGVVLC